MVTSTRNLFLRVKPWTPLSANKFWSDFFRAFAALCELYKTGSSVLLQNNAPAHTSISGLRLLAESGVIVTIHTTVLARSGTSWLLMLWWASSVTFRRVSQRFYKRFLWRLFLKVSRNFLNSVSGVLRDMGIILKTNNFFGDLTFYCFLTTVTESFEHTVKVYITLKLGYLRMSTVSSLQSCF